jgi:hypothetical protein
MDRAGPALRVRCPSRRQTIPCPGKPRRAPPWAWPRPPAPQPNPPQVTSLPSRSCPRPVPSFSSAARSAGGETRPGIDRRMTGCQSADGWVSAIRWPGVGHRSYRGPARTARRAGVARRYGEARPAPACGSCVGLIGKRGSACFDAPRQQMKAPSRSGKRTLSHANSYRQSLFGATPNHSPKTGRLTSPRGADRPDNVVRDVTLLPEVKTILKDRVTKSWGR